MSDGVETFTELYSPSLGEAVYGLWADDQPAVHAVSDAGRVTRVIANTNEPRQLYNDGLTFFDVWGTSADDLYAVGIGGRIMHYFDPAGGDEPQWVREDVELPATKSLVAGGLDKFGRPL